MFFCYFYSFLRLLLLRVTFLQFMLFNPLGLKTFLWLSWQCVFYHCFADDAPPSFEQFFCILTITLTLLLVSPFLSLALFVRSSLHKWFISSPGHHRLEMSNVCAILTSQSHHDNHSFVVHADLRF